MAKIRPKTLSFDKEGDTYTLRGITSAEENKIANAITEHQDISGKVDKVAGKGLSSNDYTDAEKTKLSGIETGAQVNPGNATQSAAGLMSATDKAKLDGIAEGATANAGTITGITMNGASKGTSGVVDLGTVITEHQDISGKVDKVNGKGLSSNDYTDAEKTKLAGIAEGATANVGTITGITMNGASKGTSGVVDLGTVITAHQDISGKLNSSLKGAANGLAELDSTGKVPSSQLPSYVDDVIDGYYYNNKFYVDVEHQTEIPGEAGKVYVDVSTNITYRWSGTTFVPIGSDLALGETSSTAYRGDRGAAAYAAAVTNVDNTPTENSEHLVTSGGVYAAIPDVSGFYTKPSTGIPSTDLADGVIPDVSGFYTKPSTGIPSTDLADGVIPDVSGFYTKPSTGIPSTDLADGVIPDVSGFYTKPSTGIPSTDLADGVIPDVSGFYTKPSTGIPSTDLADGVIPDVSGFYTKPSTGIPSTDLADGVIPDVSGKLDKTYIADGPTDFSPSIQSGMPCLFNGSQHIWTDGENIYYSNKIEQYVLDKSTSTWIFKQWNGFNNITSRQPIWTDGENIYYSQNSNQYVLNKSTSTWSTKTWSGLTNFVGDHIWKDGENIYYSNNSTQYALDKSTSTWSTKTWNGLTNFVGDHIWKDGENIYYSNDTDQYILDKSTSTWSTKTWNGYSPENGLYVWTDGENIYYSYNTKQYTLDKSTSTWSAKTWNGYSVMKANNIWKDGNTIYYSADVQYVLDKSTSTWVSKTWNGLISIDAYNTRYIWTDGENTYFSNGSIQYVFDKDISSWSVKTWIGGSNKIMGDQIWSDGENIYCSNGTYQYIFDKSTSTWSTIIWSGLTDFYAANTIWTDGENFYYSNNENQYVLDKSTSTWSAKTWTGLTSFSRSYIWTDGENIYYSNGDSAQYVLDKSTSTWNTKTWTGFTGPYGKYVWTDGENVYYSYYGSTQKYVLDKANSAWIRNKWSVNEFDGTMIWTDGENIYLDYAYKYSPTYVTKLFLGTDGEFSPVKPEKLVMVGATSSVAGAPGLVPAPTVNDSEKFLRGDGTWATPKIFIAVYGTTTYSEITTARQNDCLVFCKVAIAGGTSYRYAPLSFNYTFYEFHYYKPANNNEVDEMCIYKISPNNVWETATQEIIYNNILEYGVSTWNDYEIARRKNKNHSNGIFLRVQNSSGFYRYVTLSYVYSNNAEFNYYSSSGSENNPDKIVVYKLTKTNDEWSYTERTVKVDVMVGATSSSNGVSGSVPAPTKADVNKFLAGDGTWKFGEAMTILSYGTSTWAEFLAAYQTNSVVYCRASSNSDPSSGSKTRLAFMAYVSNETSPTNVEFQYYRSVNGHSSSGMCDEVYIYKLTNANGGTWSVTSRKAGIKEVAVGSFLTREYSSDKVTIDAKIKEISFTLKANSWSNATPPTQTVTATGVTSSSYILTEPSISITGTQYDAYMDGKIVRSAKAADSVTYKCLGAVPTVDIPMRIMVFK